ncbi:MBOAT family protein [Ancylostoma caninum]|uniref:Protein-serine O-palmitoleoyltransferase porcupine n=1 Tax=Ancylostoma caninum TaxID=29170 RepID=A0A368GYG8_ANCCA|nr:MBOAT family protein [Ancylostoma caninum]
MSINDISHTDLNDYDVFDIDEELYRAFLEDNEEWRTSYQVSFLLQQIILFLLEVNQCVIGCLSSVQYNIGKLFLVTLLQRFIAVSYLPTSVKYISSVFLGVLVLLDWISSKELMLAILAGTFCLVLVIAVTPSQLKGFMVTCACIASITLLQYFTSASEFVAVRGIVMVLAMKISSLAFDKRHDTARVAHLIPFFAYMANPATVIFGPFHTFQEFETTLNRKTPKDSDLGTHKVAFQEELLSFLCGTVLIIIAICLLVYSSCMTIVVPEGSVFTDYFTAQSFRTSHYFVSFLSQGLLALSGLRLAVSSPLSVEFPRSLVEVVIAWNIPMHRYLHAYIYVNVIPFGTAAAIFASFAISSLLHGFNFQISAVLLSLGFVCFFENKLRNRISNRFSVCARARRCRKCEHKRGWKSWQAVFLNSLFFVHSVYQLIYLGAPFDGEGASEGYDFYHTMSTWRRHYFAAHWIGLAIALLSSCI